MTSRNQRARSSALVKAIESTWLDIQRRHRSVPDVIVALGSGARKGRLKFGHYVPERWSTSGETVAELFLGGEGLEHGASELLATILHEAAHGLACARGVKDTSRYGRYHNQRFRILAEEVGLECIRTEKRGWADTSLPEGTARSYRYSRRKLDNALNLWRAPGPGGGNRNLALAMCPCKRKIRVYLPTLSLAPIRCERCGEAFAEVQPGNE